MERWNAMILRVPSLLLLATTALVAGNSYATAQQPTQAQADAIRQSCRADYQAHCSGVPTGGSAALQCLRTNLESLSPGCQSAVSAAGGSPGAAAPTSAAPQGGQPAAAPPTRMTLRQACGVDFRTLCQGVPLGGGRAIACLADHRESLSESCRGALASMRGQ
jgi:hypothetical protein